ncbi:hypothetical protein MMC08_007383, partial [Hypocenomyce scalaris]|nr:hypothetical protein [Hypocenomyce scalaris]
GIPCFLVIAIYNVYFHPLSKFPGPKLAAATQIPIARASLNGTLTQWLKELHDHYDSDVVRTGPNELSLNGPSAWRDIDSIITANDADHARMRRLLGHAFSGKALREQEPLIQSYVHNLISGLHRHTQDRNKGKVDLADWYNWTTFDVVGDLSFGRAVVFRSVVERFPALADVLAFSKSKHVRKAMQMKREQQGLVKEKVGRRLGTVTDRPDFASYILKYNDEKGMTREEMYGNMSSIIAAGSETTATLLTGATWYLHLPQHRRILGKVLAEIRGTFKTVHEINLANLSKCEYFLAVIEETFRNYPPGLAGQPRIVPEGGDIVSGYFIPGGTGVQLNVLRSLPLPPATSLNLTPPSPSAGLGTLASRTIDALRCSRFPLARGKLYRQESKPGGDSVELGAYAVALRYGDLCGEGQELGGPEGVVYVSEETIDDAVDAQVWIGGGEDGPPLP